MKIKLLLKLTFLYLLLPAVTFTQQQPPVPSKPSSFAMADIPVPTNAMIEWADAEIGVLIHFDMPVYEPGYLWDKDFNYQPSPALFNPVDLNTDQWVEIAAAAGAKYVVLVAKHASGFCLWPTKAHTYSVKSSPWRGGMGDVVGDFIASCRKYGVKPGIYCTAASDGFLGVKYGKAASGKPEDQQMINAALITMLTELWTGYGPLFEIWFDGGTLAPEKGGPEIVPLLKKYQPGAVVFQGPKGHPNLVRWIGNENARAPYPCWSTVKKITADDGTEQTEYSGNPSGMIWCPGESDVPIRKLGCFQGGWFWKAGEDSCLFSAADLIDRYYTSVGHNTNMLIGMVINDRGLVPDADASVFTEFGREVKRRFSMNFGKTSGKGDVFDIKIRGTFPVDQITIKEDISFGERVRKYVVEAMVEGQWKLIADGSCIGHRRIQKISAVKAGNFRLTIKEALATPVIKEFSVSSGQ